MQFPKQKPERDKKYLRFIASRPCCVRGCSSPRETVVPHHVDTGGLGTKCSDYRTIPVCYIHHEMIERNQDIGVDIEKEIERNRELWKKQRPINKEIVNE